MERACYRCGQTLDDSLAFCSSCGAPQIKVSRSPDQPAPEPGPVAPNSPHPIPPAAYDPASLVPGIDWWQFLRPVLPLAFLTGIATAVLPPLGFFVLLPANIVFSISRYRHRRPQPLRGGQGARMGAMTALLSFGVFLATFYLLWGTYRPLIVNKILETAAQNPDLQARQMMQWLATPEGLPIFMALFMGML